MNPDRIADMDRDRIRRKQDTLISLAQTRGLADNLRISADFPGSPTIGELRRFIFPDWEFAIDSAIRCLRGD